MSTIVKVIEEIKIKYHTDGIGIDKLPQGDWIDLKSAEDVYLGVGEFKLLNLGVSMKLPDRYEAHLAPRSSTFKKFGIIQVNGVGVIDNSYSGTNDIWRLPVLALRDTKIHKGDRICQFRIIKKQPEIKFSVVDELDNESRGGFGSTGV